MALFATPSNKKNTTPFNGLLTLFFMVMVGGNMSGAGSVKESIKLLELESLRNHSGLVKNP
jgi:hypothetical protein